MLHWYLYVWAGIRLRESRSCGGAAIIAGYARGEQGELLQGELMVSQQRISRAIFATVCV